MAIRLVAKTACVCNSNVSQGSGGFLRTAQTWANAGVCGASCAHALDTVFVCLLVVCFTCNLGDWVS